MLSITINRTFDQEELRDPEEGDDEIGATPSRGDCVGGVNDGEEDGKPT